MEAIASVASVLTLVGAATTTGRETFVLIQTSRKAPVHIKRLAAELEDLHKVLGTLHSLLAKNEMHLDQTIIEMLDNLKKVLSNCEKALLDVKKTVSHFLNHNGGIVAGRWQGFIWAAFKKEDVSTLQETLSSYKAMLNLSFAALSTLYGAHVDKMVIQIDANTSQNQNTLQHIHKAVRRLQQRVDNRDREEALRERRLQQDQGGDSGLPDGSSSRFSAAPYSTSLRASLRDFASIISSSPPNSCGPSMAVSTVSDSSTPSTSKAEPEGFEMERDSESPLGNLDYLIEEGRPLKSEGSLDHMHSIEIESDWPVSKSKLSHETLEGIHCDRPDESETKPAEDGESGIHRFEKTLDSALRSALQINSKYKVPVPARDMNESGNESGNESQLTQSHPSSTKIQSCTSSNFRGTSLPLALNAVPDSIQVTREPRYLDETEEIQRITGSLQCRIEDWKGHKLEDFGKLLLCEVLKVSQPHLTYEKRWCEVYLFERVLLCCCPKRFQPTYYSLAPSEHFPKLQLRGQVFMKTIKWVSPIPNREDRDLRVVWRSDERVEFLDLDFQDLGTRSMWEVYLEQRTVATEGDETEGEHSTELPSLL